MVHRGRTMRARTASTSGSRTTARRMFRCSQPNAASSGDGLGTARREITRWPTTVGVAVLCLIPGAFVAERCTAQTIVNGSFEADSWGVRVQDPSTITGWQIFKNDGYTVGVGKN